MLAVLLASLLAAGPAPTAPADSISCTRTKGWLPATTQFDLANLPHTKLPGEQRPTRTVFDSLQRTWDSYPPEPWKRMPGTWILFRDDSVQATYFVTRDSFPLLAYVLAFNSGQQVQLRYTPGIAPEDRLRWVARHDYSNAWGRGHYADWGGRRSGHVELNDEDVRWGEDRIRRAVLACGGVPKEAAAPR